MDGSSLAVLQNTAILAHRDAGGGAVHSIMNGHLLKLVLFLWQPFVFSLMADL
jgi:hypothetical protein